MTTPDHRNSPPRESTAGQVDPWRDDGARPARSRDVQMSELRQRRPGLFTLHEAAINAVTAREHAHEVIARRMLDRAAELIDAGLDERAAAETAHAELAADEAAEPEQLQHSLDERARRVASPVIDRDREARVLAVPVTEQDIDNARTVAERDLLIDLAACQHAITRLRDTRYSSTAAEATGLYLECREQHGHDRDQAGDAAFLEVSEGIRAEHDTARYRLDAEAEQRRDERATVQRHDAHGGVNQDADHDVAVPAQRDAGWEEVRAPLLRVGDVTPRGPVTALDYHGEIGVTVHVGDEEYHRRRDDLVSRRTERYTDPGNDLPERKQPRFAHDRAVARRETPPSVEDSRDVDADELAQLTAGAQQRRATASQIPDDLDRLHDTLLRDHEPAPQHGQDDPQLHQHTALVNRQAVSPPSTEDTRRRQSADPVRDVEQHEQAHGHSDDPVQHARSAVDLLAARRRDLDERQRLEQDRSQQLNRWQHDHRQVGDTADTADTASITTGGRVIDGWGLGR